MFRDLILVARSDAKGGPFFLDRFESTRCDVRQWLTATGTPSPGGWPEHWLTSELDSPVMQRPATRVDLTTARAFARWRFCRLPIAAEWEHAATAGGSYRYPWGDHGRPQWANTPELGLGQTGCVGTFESGRAPGGPYDLVGNVAEWTESLDAAFLRDLDACERLPAVAVWSVHDVPAPCMGLVLGASYTPARVVVGGAFVGLSERLTGWAPATALELRRFDLLCRPDEWSDTTGVRVAADPLGLLVALLREASLPPEPAVRLLRTFLTEPAHRAVLAPELPAAVARAGDQGALLGLVRSALRQ